MATVILSVPGLGTPQSVRQHFKPSRLDDSVLWTRKWTNGEAGPTTRLEYGWTYERGIWPSRSGFLNDPAAPCCLIAGNSGMDRGAGIGPDSQLEVPNGGSQSSKYIMGQCKDSVGTPVGGAVVQCFRTVDDLRVDETASDDQGRYEVRCPNTPTDQHYLVAFVDSSPDLGGTTVNTLVPTWRDGTT